MVNPYTSDDFAAFLMYAGPPPSEIDERQRSYPSVSLEARLNYVGKCDKFCEEYFNKATVNRMMIGVNVGDWVEFYQEFIEWYRIRQGMADEIETKGLALHRRKPDMPRD